VAESTLSLTYARLRRECGRVADWNRDPSQWTSDETTDIADCIATGINWFYHPPPQPGEFRSHVWSFLNPKELLTLNAPYSTGTIEVAAGVVTLTTGTFPAWAAAGHLRIGTVLYSVATRTNDTEIVLDDTTVTVAAGSSYELVRFEYELPDDFGGVNGRLFYRPDSSTLTTYEIKKTSDASLEEQLRQNAQANRPFLYAVREIEFDGSGSEGQRFEIVLWPIPDAAYVIEIPYVHLPYALSSTYTFPLGGQIHSETILEACLAAVELKLLDNPRGPHRERFEELLKASIQRDRTLFSPDTLGVERGAPSDTRVLRRSSVEDITFINH
jgi:hypothetical protein